MTSRSKIFNLSAPQVGARDTNAFASEVGLSPAGRFKLAGREESKLLAKAEDLIVEYERRVRRQALLIEELRAGGTPTLEAEKSLARLDAAVIEQRAQSDVLAAKANDIGISLV